MEVGAAIMLCRHGNPEAHLPPHERLTDMARIKTIALAQSTYSPAQFACYMRMPTKLSAAQIVEGLFPPSKKELDAAEAEVLAKRAARKAEREAQKAAAAPKAKTAKAKSSKAKAPKEPKAPKAPQTAEKMVLIFGSLKKGFTLTVRQEDAASLKFEVVKVNKKSIVLADGAKLHLKGETRPRAEGV
jgi:hypothetical protein